MKHCYKCGEHKPLDAFSLDKYRRSGKSNRCRKCSGAIRKQIGRDYFNRARRKWGKENGQEYRERDKKKIKARQALGSAIRSGKIIKKGSCVSCGYSPSECHHNDYNEPLIFVELCKKCHMNLHNKKIV